uniref:Succinate dehydrogenase cytochrome subunit 4 n=1 Tax=Cunninghamia lanceolata TaxID=28977 RepID=A0A8F4MFK3_CUNLA|nr:succinate dehydrogenase cytochrome subunit 4 [Cunninghamia lanceolata]BDG69815.1 succinate dehydrogenase cytochrome subunit 4 [Cunninghamia lanceolata var. konishii]
MVLAFRRRGSVIPICLYPLVGRSTKGRIIDRGGLGNESLLAGRVRIIDRGGLGYELFSGTEITRDRKGSFLVAASLLPLMIISDEVYLTLLPDIYSFWHISAGIEEIMADHVHQGMTRNWISILLGSFFLIVIKDVFPFPSRLFHHEWNNPMVDR